MATAGDLLQAIALSALLSADPECAEEAWRRHVLAQARLFELHDADEKLREALAQALAGCAAGPAGAACRTRAQARVQADRDSRRSEIDDRYRRLLRELDDRCRSTVI